MAPRDRPPAPPSETSSEGTASPVKSKPKPKQQRNSNNQATPILAACQHLLQPNGSIRGQAVADVILPRFATFCSAIPVSNRHALASIDGRMPISHGRVRDFIRQDFGDTLHRLGFGKGDRIAVVLPNGPELALAIVSTIQWASCVPLSAHAAHSELAADLQRCGANLVLGPCSNSSSSSMSPRSVLDCGTAVQPDDSDSPDDDNPFCVMRNNNLHKDWSVFGHVEETAHRLGIPFVGLVPSRTEAGIFWLNPPEAKIGGLLSCRPSCVADDLFLCGAPQPAEHEPSSTEPNTADDEVLVLFTSGTTGNKKLVPHLLGDMLVAATTISLSWALTPNDVNCNLMPLFHVGGICRQVFSPLLSGGCVICCPSFDPSIFWALLARGAFNWYYAAPTMHQLILQTGRQPVGDNLTLEQQVQPRLRMIANAAGGLLPSLARELRAMFGDAHVLPSYGMTECMPISSPPSNYCLEKPGTSGVAVGPEIAIIGNTRTVQHLPPGKEGQICVRGVPCFRGYGRIAGAVDDDHDDSPPKPLVVRQETVATETDKDYFDLVDDSYSFMPCLFGGGYNKQQIANEAEQPIKSIHSNEAALNVHPSWCGGDDPWFDILPCFRGYGVQPRSRRTDSADDEQVTFLKGGWFMTGDLGYMDKDGYLYVTGRSKEVINRGGEIISPMEVEEAVVNHPNVVACAAFGAQHNVLQEVVAIVLVMAPGSPRLDLTGLHEHLGAHLAAPKWPQCIVYMDGGLPKSHTNKLLRVNLGKRLGLAKLRDDMHPMERTFEAKCPPQGTPLDVPIPAKLVTVSASDVQSKLVSELETSHSDSQLFVVPHPSRPLSLVCHIYNLDRDQVIQMARQVLDGYAVPSHFVVMNDPATSVNMLAAPQPADAVASILQSNLSTGPIDALVQEIQEIFSSLLGLEYLPGPDANFFRLGGSSMLASQLASKIRKHFDTPCSGAQVFHHPSCNELANLVRHHKEETVSTSRAMFSNKFIGKDGSPYTSEFLAPQSSCFSLLFQYVPMFVVFPIWQVTRYLLFFVVLFWSLDFYPDQRDIGTFVVAVLLFQLCWVTVTPLVFVAIKWIVIGRYRPGRYPIWGSYYWRWWFVDICRKLFLLGVWGWSEITLNAYYRLLGAKIGKGARIILECDVAEFDLVTVGENAAVEDGTLRGFGVDNGAMVLGPVTVGKEASVGAKSVVAPYTTVLDGCHLGPVTSSHDVDRALDAKHARVNRKFLPEPNVLVTLFFGAPIVFFVNCVAEVPPFLILYLMLGYKPESTGFFSTPSDLMAWLCDPRRIPFYIAIRVTRDVVSPFFYMAMAIIVKKLVIGRFKDGPRNINSQWQLLRHWLAATLLARKHIQDVTNIIGRHYELVSVLYRMLGAEVGKRVFWPGHLPICSGEFDLLVIGDDCVFGSRSALFFTTENSCEKIVLCAGANVADNCVVLPGSVIGKNAVLGSSSVCPEGWYLPEGSVWFGSTGCEPVCLEKGIDDSGRILSPDVFQLLGDDSTLRPFGKAFYKGQASYFVMPLCVIVTFSFLAKCLIAAFHSLPLLGALYGASVVLYGFPFDSRDFTIQYSFGTIYVYVLLIFMLTHWIRFVLWLAIDLTAKWTLMGRRKEGRYNYDNSSYAQRWEIYQIIGKLRKLHRMSFLEFFSGTPFLASYFRWNGGNIGKDCCLYPAGADPFMPEPDLVEMGDRCVIDCASIVCHLNTRGNFELTKTVMEDECTLRSRSRLQQGVYMEQGSMLLEKSVAMTGEVIEAGNVWQGAPASRYFQSSA